MMLGSTPRRRATAPASFGVLHRCAAASVTASFTVALLTTVALSTAVPSTARATTIDPLLWQQLVEGAAFVGVVECDRAGGIVAGYRVVEVWKGERVPGDRITIRTPPDIWGPQYPLALVGDRLAVAAYAGEAPRTMASTSSGPALPPEWRRRVPHDYALPLFQGTARVAGPFGRLGTARTSLPLVKADFVAFVGAPEEARDLAIVRALAAKWRRRIDEARAARALGAVERAPTLDAAIDAGVAAGARGDVQSVHWFFEDAGPRIKARAAARGATTLPDRPRPVPAPLTTPTPDELVALRETVALAPLDGDAWEPAAARLVAVDCGAVVERVRAHTLAPGVERADRQTAADAADAPYFLGAWVAVACGGDRARHLTTLLDAREPFIRVAAAIHLAHVDEARGTAALRALTTLPGDPGAWAALALARRGDASSLPRVVTLLADATERGAWSSVHHNLQLRALELLSNTAAARGQKTPVAKIDRRAHRLATTWLRANADAVPVDPWFATLAAQGVD